MGIWWEMIGTNESTWWPSDNHGANTKKVLEYIDFASENSFEGLLVEGWNKGWHPEWCCSGDGKKFSFTETQPDFDIDKISINSDSVALLLCARDSANGTTAPPTTGPPWTDARAPWHERLKIEVHM